MYLSTVFTNSKSNGALSTSHHTMSSISPFSTNTPEGPSKFNLLSASMVSLIVTKTQECPVNTNDCTTGAFSSSSVAWITISGLCISLMAIATTVFLVLGCILLHRKCAVTPEKFRRASNTYKLSKTPLQCVCIYVLFACT